MTKEQFVERWRCHLTGLALYGVISDATDNVLKRSAKVFDIPKTVESLLEKLYEDATKPNGKPPERKP